MNKWRLEGLDTFSDESYPLQGEHDSQQAAETAADEHLKELEIRQPTESSGGQSDDGIQDRVFIIRPDGTKYRYRPFSAVSCEVIVKESEGSVIVKKEDGTNESILTGLPNVNKGHKGIILETGEHRLFIREPYGGFEDDRWS